jgi:DNA (cytosine-5)-methyltransferase 1
MFQKPNPESTKLGFIDIFAGAGGLSLGLLNAGWEGILAIEKSPMAFETLEFNLINQKIGPSFQWPTWLPIKAFSVQDFIQSYTDHLEELNGIPLLAGGPPCQGFSRAGRRQNDDERNRLFEDYLSMVDAISPQMLLIENVTGFTETFERPERAESDTETPEKGFNADEELRSQLHFMGYTTFTHNALMAKDFGVPQSRPRYILIGIKNSLLNKVDKIVNPFETLNSLKSDFLERHGLATDRAISLKEAISDLLKVHGYIPCIEPNMTKFSQGQFGPVEGKYQELMRVRRDGTLIAERTVADSHRFVNHKSNTVERLKKILSDIPAGKRLSKAEVEELNLNKHRIARLSADAPCHTLTGTPDDMVHYCEPRILTVREYARIQSFPDWFEFKSNYTTGGKRRRVEVPRYTQAANAVAPLLAQVLGETLLRIYRELTQEELTITMKVS